MFTQKRESLKKVIILADSVNISSVFIKSLNHLSRDVNVKIKSS